MKRNRGFTLIELMVVVSIIGILALIAIPNFQSLRQKAWDTSALSAGRNAKMAQEIYFQAHQNEFFDYTSSLADLVIHDRNLADDTGVTFIFNYNGDTNYTFTTMHVHGYRSFIYHD